MKFASLFLRAIFGLTGSMIAMGSVANASDREFDFQLGSTTDSAVAEVACPRLLQEFSTHSESALARLNFRPGVDFLIDAEQSGNYASTGDDGTVTYICRARTSLEHRDLGLQSWRMAEHRGELGAAQALCERDAAKVLEERGAFIAHVVLRKHACFVAVMEFIRIR